MIRVAHLHLNLLKTDFNRKNIMIPEKEKFIVENAGLIILNPFLKGLFTRLRLLDKNENIIDKPLAANILYYAATGNNYESNYEMTFEKFICDISLKSSISVRAILSDSIRNEVDELLLSVLIHWEVLKSDSTELLRNEFLKRKGKIVIENQKGEVIIDKKSQDILLDKLPWNIRSVKFPWKKEVLRTYW